VTDVPRVAALQVRDPIAMLILMKSNDASLRHIFNEKSPLSLNCLCL